MCHSLILTYADCPHMQTETTLCAEARENGHECAYRRNEFLDSEDVCQYCYDQKQREHHAKSKADDVVGKWLEKLEHPALSSGKDRKEEEKSKEKEYVDDVEGKGDGAATKQDRKGQDSNVGDAEGVAEEEADGIEGWITRLPRHPGLAPSRDELEIVDCGQDASSGTRVSSRSGEELPGLLERWPV